MTTTVASLQAIFTADTTSLMRGLSSVDSALDKAGGNISKLGSSITGFGSQTAALTAPMVGAFGYATHASLEFRAAMTNVNSILQLSEQDISNLSAEVLAMGTNAIAGPQQTALAFYDIVGGVADATTHMAILEAAIATSEAGAASLTGTTSALVSVMNSYGLKAEDAAYVSDVLTTAVAKGVFTMDELAAALPNVTGLAASLDVSFDDLAGAMAYMSTKGFSASQSATQLQAIMTATLKPNENMIAALEELGYTAATAGDLIGDHGLVGAMELIGTTSTVADEGLAAVLGTTEALNGVIGLTADGASEFLASFVGLGEITPELTASLQDLNETGLNPNTIAAFTGEMIASNKAMNGATKRARDIQRASPAAEFKLMKAQVEGLAIEVGTALLPALSKLFEAVSPLISKFSAWVQANPELVSQIAMAVGVVAALSAVLIPLGMVISVVGTLVTGLGAVIGLLSLPLTLAIAAVVAFALAYKTNFMGLRDTINEAVSAVMPYLDLLWQGLKAIWDKAQPALQAIRDWFLNTGLPIIRVAIDTFIQYWINFATVLAGIWDRIKPALEAVFSWFVMTGLPAVRGAVEMAIGGVQFLIATLVAIWTKIEPTLSAVFNWFVVAGLPAIRTAIDATVVMVNLMIERINRIWNAVSGTVGLFLTNMTNTFSGVGTAVDLVTTAIDDMITALNDIPMGVLDKVLSAGGSIFGSTIPKNAHGGVVHGGQPTLVGERGAEIFTPSGSGFITNNNRLNTSPPMGRSGGGSGAIQLVINGTVIVQGVQDTSSLLDKLVQEASRRSGAVAVAL